MADTFKLLLGRARVAWLLLPVVAMFLLAWAVVAGVDGLNKRLLEPLALVSLGAFLAACLVRLAVQREVFFLWATGLLACLLMRELHFDGTSNGVYIGLLVLLIVGLRYFDNLKSYLDSPRLVTLVMTGLFSYALSVTVDQRWWRGFPGEDVFHTPLEESMEMLGHLLIGLGLVFSRREAPDPQGAPEAPASPD